jgi:hypothetical protein
MTHALMTALTQDRKLLGSFLRELIKVEPPAPIRKLSVLEQQYPGEPEPLEEELERRGVPDGWIYDQEDCCVFIESKVLTKLRPEQIKNHRHTAERRGYSDITAVAIAPALSVCLPPDVIVLEWRTIYAWLRQRSEESAWAGFAANYLEIVEAKLIDTQQFKEGSLTKFAGFPFGPDRPYAYPESKTCASPGIERTSWPTGPQESAWDGS